MSLLFYNFEAPTMFFTLKHDHSSPPNNWLFLIHLSLCGIWLNADMSLFSMFISTIVLSHYLLLLLMAKCSDYNLFIKCFEDFDGDNNDISLESFLSNHRTSLRNPIDYGVFLLLWAILMLKLIQINEIANNAHLNMDFFYWFYVFDRKKERGGDKVWSKGRVYLLGFLK